MGYSRYSGGGFLNAGTPFLVLQIVAFIAAIVCTVIVYRKYVTPGRMYSRGAVDKHSALGSFLRFDTLIIEKLLKALYLFGAIYLVFFMTANLISSLFAGGNAFVAALVVFLVAVPLGEVIHRITYEFLMLNIVIARNSTEIRSMMQDDRSVMPVASDGKGSGSTGVTGTYSGGVDPVATPQNVCPHCNAPLKPGQKFCGVCGNSLN